MTELEAFCSSAHDDAAWAEVAKERIPQLVAELRMFHQTFVSAMMGAYNCDADERGNYLSPSEWATKYLRPLMG